MSNNLHSEGAIRLPDDKERIEINCCGLWLRLVTCVPCALPPHFSISPSTKRWRCLRPLNQRMLRLTFGAPGRGWDPKTISFPSPKGGKRASKVPHFSASWPSCNGSWAPEWWWAHQLCTGLEPPNPSAALTICRGRSQEAADKCGGCTASSETAVASPRAGDLHGAWMTT